MVEYVARCAHCAVLQLRRNTQSTMARVVCSADLEPDDLGSDDPDHDLLDDVDEAEHPPSSSRQTRP